jgi:hypothetical protein
VLDPGSETALVDTLRRMEALCAKLEAGEVSDGIGGKVDGVEARVLVSVGGEEEGRAC